MKRQDLTKYQQEETAVLEQKIAEMSVQRAELTLEKALGRVKNLHQPAQLKKDIARLKTIINERKLAAQKQA